MASIKELISDLDGKPELSKSLMSAATPQEAADIATKAGYSVTADELLDAYKTSMAKMSEEELSDVAGGKGDDNHYNHYGTTTTTYVAAG